ncbi:hypothetical protein [Mesorhizobium sp. M0296]|uniref:hypothetical protein n=1 Tax=Mesorhizobium sp. M0296 TaxID=2956931 RepID=UPI003337843D
MTKFTDPMFPILGDPIVKAIPWDAIRPHEVQALKNHYQALNRLAQRGGLSVVEAVLVMLGKPLHFNKITPGQMAHYRVILMQELMRFERERVE